MRSHASSAEHLPAGGTGGLRRIRILAALEDDMLSQHDLSLTWLDILDRLRQSPDQRMRMNELEQASLFTRSGLTRLIDKMEQAGFVQRERVPDDRRGIYVTITAAGHEKVSRVWPDLGTSIHEHFGRHLDQDDAHAIIRALSTVLPEGEGPLVSPRPRRTIDHRQLRTSDQHGVRADRTVPHGQLGDGQQLLNGFRFGGGAWSISPRRARGGDCCLVRC